MAKRKVFNRSWHLPPQPIMKMGIWHPGSIMKAAGLSLTAPWWILHPFFQHERLTFEHNLLSHRFRIARVAKFVSSRVRLLPLLFIASERRFP